MLIFVSTCKQITQSEPTEFSKNGVFHSKAVVITFTKCLYFNLYPTLQYCCVCFPHTHETLHTATLLHVTPLLQKIYRNRIPEKFRLKEI